MHLQKLCLLSLIGLVAGANIPRQGTTCFDDGDCYLAGGTCVKQSGKITGTCSGKSTSSATATATSSAATASATGATCYDDNDCSMSGGGHCVKSGSGLSGILGHCQK